MGLALCVGLLTLFSPSLIGDGRGGANSEGDGGVGRQTGRFMSIFQFFNMAGS